MLVIMLLVVSSLTLSAVSAQAAQCVPADQVKITGKATSAVVLPDTAVCHRDSGSRDFPVLMVAIIALGVAGLATAAYSTVKHRTPVRV